uniref:G-protein coupled receptors family 1 profile domain-containing protein n=1 Tax=Oryzias latipes TaxID=8090 RepID=A0A3B3H441_ORYLA
MALNSSVISGGSPVRILNNRILIVQVAIVVCLCINFFLISTFFRKNIFYTTMRYILFAVTLLSDCLFLIMSNALLVSSYFSFTIQIWLCFIMYTILSVYALVTPLTLTAMTLERYVAICMPLRHAELCTTRGALQLILIIHSIIIVFSYVQIMKAAKSASGENKKSTWKGLRTVILHAFQLLLCLIQLWLVNVDPTVYKNVRSFNYIMFFLAPICLSPLIYGLREELVFQLNHSFKMAFFWLGNIAYKSL